MDFNLAVINNEEWIKETIAQEEEVLAGLPADQHPWIKASIEHHGSYWRKRLDAIRLVNQASSSSSPSTYPRRPDTRKLAAARDMLSGTPPNLSPHARHVLASLESVIAKYETNEPEVRGKEDWRGWWELEKAFLILTGIVPDYFESFF
jgi:hypothetical protein